MKNLTIYFFSLSIFVGCSTAQKNYPENWWKSVDKKSAKWWEILPQDADKKKNEVILSKRNELGILSNFSHTPFTFEGKKYESVEGVWQSMKFPETVKDDRFKKGLSWKFKRTEVAQMVAFKAKKAGGIGSKNMKSLGINYVTWKGKKMTYRTSEKGDHYNLIKKLMWAKVEQNPKVKDILLATGDLNLRPDHRVKPEAPPAWRYFDIWMEIRSELKKKASQK
ncbi:MAG: NADAR family protein [Bacteriovoracaceae bacterium]|nr:NADAR family protein [Bacteriovoracaceae bacterium]